MNKKGHVTNALLLSLGLGVILSVNPWMDPAQVATTETLTATAQKVGELTIPIVLGALFPDVDTDFGRHRKTLHNLPVLGLFLAFPYVFGNLYFVWIGVATHYVLDVVGSRRGIALFYPLSAQEYDLPVGVPVKSKWADHVTLAVSALELGALALVHYFVFSLDVNIQQAAAAVGV